LAIRANGVRAAAGVAVVASAETARGPDTIENGFAAPIRESHITIRDQWPRRGTKSHNNYRDWLCLFVADQLFAAGNGDRRFAHLVFLPLLAWRLLHGTRKKP
jgi:hypothetical protein